MYIPVQSPSERTSFQKLLQMARQRARLSTRLEHFAGLLPVCARAIESARVKERQKK